MALVAHLERPPAAQHLRVDVVAVAGLAGVDDRAQGAPGEAQVEHGGVPVPGALEGRPLGPQHRPHRRDLSHLVRGEEAGQVEVVDGHVHELPPAAGDVALRGRVGIVADGPEEVDVTDLAGRDAPPCFLVAGIVAALEADLQGDAGPAHGRQGPLGGGDVQGHRLLAQDGLPGAGGGLDQGGVGGGRGDDHHRLHVRAVHRRQRLRHHAGPQAGPQGLHLGAGIGDQDEARRGQRGQDPGVPGPQATGPDQGHRQAAHGGGHVSSFPG